MTNENRMFEYKIGGGELKLSERDRNSVEILRSLQKSGSFNRVGENVCFYALEGGSPFHKVSIEDYLKAVDFYYANRESELSVNFKMKIPDGIVNVYSPHLPDLPEDQICGSIVVATLQNFHVPQMLEFAYLLARRELNKRKK